MIAPGGIMDRFFYRSLLYSLVIIAAITASSAWAVRDAEPGAIMEGARPIQVGAIAGEVATPGCKATGTPPPERGAHIQAQTITIGMGQYWKGCYGSKKYLIIEARLDYRRPAGSQCNMKVMINDKALTLPLKNKGTSFHYADGRTFPYYDPQTCCWSLFYCDDFSANNGKAGGGYQVMTDPGQSYLYRWDISSLAGKGPVSLKIANTSSLAQIVCRVKLVDQ
jgi:hypothetical protein